MVNPLLYYHTIRHLQPVQIYGRLLHGLKRTRVDATSAPSLRDPVHHWREAPCRQRLMHGPCSFNFLNQSRDINNAQDWNDQSVDKLWLYNLHYFDDLNAEDSGERKAWHIGLIDRWMRDNPPGHGNGWEPYPLSLRIVNWIKWSLAGNELTPAILQSLATQVRFLLGNIEYHIRGNHLLANAKALVFAGLFFEGDEADEWLARGLGILKDEVKEQVLPDGGHFERSPMYHAIVLEDLLDIANILQTYDHALLHEWKACIERMLQWLSRMSHPDGEIVLFNDAAIGIARTPGDLMSYAERFGFYRKAGEQGGLAHLSDTGYVRLEKGNAVAFLDIAPIGPDYLPAHGHADALSFELSVGGQRVLVDSGVSRYQGGAERSYQRGTAAHNTVCIDGKNSSEVWGSFRVALRARVLDVQCEETGGLLRVSAKHDGYRRLHGKPLHCRQWLFDENRLIIEDRVLGSGTHDINMMYHIHPGIVPSFHKEKLLLLKSKDGKSLAEFELDDLANWRLEDATYHPEFGMSVPTRKLVGFWSGSLPARFVSKCIYWS